MLEILSIGCPLNRPLNYVSCYVQGQFIDYDLSCMFTTEHGECVTGLPRRYEFPIDMATKTKDLPDTDMEAFIQERTQQLFLLSDRERKGFIVKRDMQVTNILEPFIMHIGLN